MKTKTWILLFAVLVLVCVALSFFLLRKQNADSVKVISNGEVKYVLPLSQDTQVTITTDRGSNTITVKDGKVAVTAADCPDGYCMARGYCDAGAQIVCLPNRLVLEFTNQSAVDAVVG